MAIDFIKSHWNFTGVDKYYYQLENIFVETKTGYVFDSKGEPVFKLYYESLFWGPAIPAKSFQAPPLLTEVLCKKYVKVNQHSNDLKAELEANSELPVIKEAAYLLHPFGWYAYGHLHDSLMRLYSLPEVGDSCKLLCCDFRRVVEFEEHIQALDRKSTRLNSSH